MFEPSLLRGHHDADVLLQRFNSQSLSRLDKVTPVTSSLVSVKNRRPRVDETIRNLRRTCGKAERLWKSTKLVVQRLHLKEPMTSVNEMMKLARTGYFSNIF